MFGEFDKFDKTNLPSALRSRSTFVKITLGNYKGTDEHLQKILVRLVKTKKGTRLFFLYRGDTRDTAKNFDFNTGIALISEALETAFFSGHLFTTDNDFQLDIGKKGKSRLNVAKPTFKAAPPLDHDREKTAQIDADSSILKPSASPTTTAASATGSMTNGGRSTNLSRFSPALVDKSELKDKRELKIVDMGSGKGYLTFAAYDYFKNVRGRRCSNHRC